MAKKNANPGSTVPRQFRLEGPTLEDLDLIAATRAVESGARVTRTDAVRIAAKDVADRIRRAAKKQGAPS